MLEPQAKLKGVVLSIDIGTEQEEAATIDAFEPSQSVKY